MAKIGVIGAGVMGVVGATLLQERGHNVTIVTSQKPEDTLSQRVPPAIILPSVAHWTEQQLESGGMKKIHQWEKASIEVFSAQAMKPGNWVTGCDAVMLFDEHQGDEPYWRDDYPRFDPQPQELPGGFEFGWSFSTYIVNPRGWLGNLLSSFQENGGKLVMHEVSALPPKGLEFDAWLACPGMGALNLFRDEHPDQIFGRRGQLMEVQAPDVPKPVATRAVIQSPARPDVVRGDRFAYIVPIHDDNGDFGTGRFILGGTLDPVNNEELSALLEPSMAVASEIFEKCVKLVPQLSTAQVLGHRVGVRPCRKDGIRIERYTPSTKVPIIAAYGSATDGFSQHRCMADAVKLVEQALL